MIFLMVKELDAYGSNQLETKVLIQEKKIAGTVFKYLQNAIKYVMSWGDDGMSCAQLSLGSSKYQSQFQCRYSKRITINRSSSIDKKLEQVDLIKF